MKSLFAVALLILAGCREKPDPLASEFARLTALQTKLEAGSVPGFAKEAVQPNRESLERARKTTSPELRLYRLRDAYVGIEAIAFIADHKDATLEQFIALWKSKPVDATNAPAKTSLLNASLVESSANRAEKLYRASLPYGKADGPLSGLYYLGEAHANAAFARFVASLGGGKSETPPEERALRDSIDGMEAEMVHTFASDRAKPAMIGTSARLKEARELLNRGSLAGATLMLLEAQLSYGRNTAPEVKGQIEPPANLPNDSMAALWRASDNPVAARDVLPYYVALRTPGHGRAPKVEINPVEVTLLRWPYT